MLSLKKRNDYDVSFRKAIKLLHREERITRLKETEIMCEKYYQDNGERPADYMLESLADVLLHEELTDTRVDKMTIEEYPILSESQIRRRKSGSNSRAENAKCEVLLDVDYIDELSSLGSLGVYVSIEKPSVKQEIDAETSYYRELNKAQPIAVSYIEPIQSNILRFNTNGRGEDHRVWADAVKERDGYRCQNPRCNNRAGIMHAHHIYNYADFPEMRYEVSNGITLCEPCHTEFHSIYGKNDTNRQELTEFFAS